MKIEAGVATDIGKVREGNEDSYLAEHPLYAVADGMGGHRGGEVASQLALETVEALFRSGAGSLAQQVRDANRAVFDRSAEDRKVTGMGTTLTAAVIEGDAAHLVHVGDSRAYLLRAGSLRRLTEDHTLVNRMVRAGEISPAEAEVHPHRNVLLRALGTEADVDVDEQEVGLLEADRLLLCSDGLTSMVTEDQVQAILEATPSPKEAADRLVRAANRAGGLDNITVVVLDVVEGRTGVEADVDAAPVGAERPRPGGSRPRRALRWGLAAGLVIAGLLAGFTAFRAWLDGRWYVGVAEGNVAIYQGVPVELLGFELSQLEVQTDLPADEVQALPVYSGLEEGVNANSRQDAEAIVEQMRKDLRRQRRAEREAIA
jgi:PPM family protein phosphatase